jgi:hypothetical protein
MPEGGKFHPGHSGAGKGFISHSEKIYIYEKLENHSVGSSLLVGNEVWVPKRVTLSPAALLALRMHSDMGMPCATKNAKQPRKQSPAPVVSTAWTFSSMGTKVDVLVSTKRLPLSPSVITTWVAPLKRRFQYGTA